MGWEDQLPIADAAQAPQRPQTWEDSLPLATQQPTIARGVKQAWETGYQHSLTGTMIRKSLPELMLHPTEAPWWEKVIAGVSEIGYDLPEFMGGAKVGVAAGARIGGAVGSVVPGVGTVGGTVAGGLVGGGAASFAMRAAAREALWASYRARDAQTPADFLAVTKAVASVALKEGVVGATLGPAGLAAKATVGRVMAPIIGKRAEPAATILGQVAAMTAVPAAIEGHAPTLQDTVNGAIIVTLLSGGHAAVSRVTGKIGDAWVKTGKSVPEIVADAKADPTIKEDLTAPEPAPEAPRGTPERYDPIKIQEELFKLEPRLNELDRQTAPPITREAAALVKSVDEGGTPTAMTENLKRIATENGIEVTPETTPNAVVDAIRAKATETLGIAPAGPTEAGRPVQTAIPPELITERDTLRSQVAALQTRLAAAKEFETTTERMRMDFLQQLRQADEARVHNNLEPVGDAHSQAAAQIMTDRIASRARRLGISLDQAYNEMHPTVKSGFYMDDPRLEQADHRAFLEQAAEERRKTMPKAPAKLSSLLGDIKTIGGIAKDDMADVMGDTKVTKGMPADLFHKNGKGIDELATSLKARNWNIDTSTVDGGVQQLKDMIKEEIGSPGANIKHGDEEAVGLRNERDRAQFEVQAIKKALAGERMGSAEEDAVREYLDQKDAMAKMGPQAYDEAKAAIETHKKAPAIPENVVDVDAVERAVAIDEDAVDLLSRQHENDTPAFMAGIRRILNDASQRPDAGGQDAARAAAEGGEEGTAASAGEIGASRVAAANESNRGASYTEGAGVIEEDPSYTVGHEVRQDERIPENSGKQTPEGQLDILAPAQVPGSPIQALEKIVVEPQQIGKRKIAFRKVTNASTAAGVFQDLNKSPREKFQALGLDANGKPVAFFDLFAGTLTQTSVYPRELWTALYQTPGIRKVWVAHQHPSGVAQPSAADINLTKALRAALTPDIGVTLEGHLIITKDATIDIGPSGDFVVGVNIKPGEPRYTLPIVERQITKQEGKERSLNSPTAVRDLFSKFSPNETGLLLLDAQNHPTGWWPMSVEEMSKLRTGDINTGLAALLRQVGRNNPGAAIAYSPIPDNASFRRGVENVGNALRLADVKMIDAVTDEGNGKMISFAERGTSTGGTGTFFQRNAQRRGEIHQASYNVADRVITLFKTADRSSIIHELGHDWLEEMKADAARPDAPMQIKDDWNILRREFAIPENGPIPTQAHEQHAKTVERYFAEGFAPSLQLKAIFERFKNWMLEIYKTVKGLGIEINPELRGVFDRYLATDEQIADARALGVPRAYVELAKDEIKKKIVPGFVAEQVSIQPYADELPAGPGTAPTNSHVNYKYINAPMNVKLTIQRIAELDQEAIQKRRGGTEGVKSWEETDNEIRDRVRDILGGGKDTAGLFADRDPNKAGPDMKLRATYQYLVGLAKHSATLRDGILQKGHDAPIEEQLEYMASIERVVMTHQELLGQRAEVGRALNIIKNTREGSGDIGKMVEMLSTGQDARVLMQTAKTADQVQAEMKAELERIMLKYRGKTVLDIAKLHKEIGTLKGSYQFAKETAAATTWDKVVEGWKSALLSGLVTHVTNFFGTGAFQVLRPVVDILASGVGMVRGAQVGMGETDRASMREGIARLTGYLGATQDALKVGYHTFQSGETTGKTEAFRQAIPGRAGEIIRIPLRAMAAEDAMVNTMYERGELRTIAMRQAFTEGLNPLTREFSERVDSLTDNPTPEIKAMAQAEATRMTFNADLGSFGRSVQRTVSLGRLEWMLPFIRTPINITKEVGRMTPFAFMVPEWKAAIRQGGIAKDRAIAEVVLGTGIMALTMAYAFGGNISGAGEPDPGKKRAKTGTWQPYSIKIGDTWYEYSRIQPMGTLIGVAADMAEVWDHMTDEEMDKIPKMLGTAFANAVTNQTFLQGITNVVNAMSEPQRFFPRFAQQMAGSLVPNIVGQTTTMTDPYVREVNGMLDAIRARIPGMREQMLPKRDWLGQPVETKERLGLVSPIRMQDISEDKVRLEADRLNISVGIIPRKIHIGKGTGKIGDVEITPDQRNKFAEVSGEFAHRILDDQVNSPGWDERPDIIKRKIFSRVLLRAHKAGAMAAFPPELRQEAIQGINEKMQAELQGAH